MDLFTLEMENKLKTTAPLPERMRPKSLEDFVGQGHFIGENQFINRMVKSGRLRSMLFYGPPGVGKTTLAYIIAQAMDHNFIELSAVTSGVKDLREALKEAEEDLKIRGRQTILFIDEIHRFNKGQQDALLPYVEQGKILFIGATTENPYFEVNKALVSRCQILNFHELGEEDLKKLALRALEKDQVLKDFQASLDPQALDFLVNHSNKDARVMLAALEMAVLTTTKRGDQLVLTKDDISQSMMEKPILYDKGSTDHYDTISAFIKSLRGSDPDAALYWMAKMLVAGEDPKFIARRMVIFASEDIGNADPMALVLATSTFKAVEVIGLPECRINLGQCASYLACAEKSNRAYQGINAAMDFVKSHPSLEVPMALREGYNPRVEKEREEDYKYPHNYEDAYVDQNYLPPGYESLTFYQPSQRGMEGEILQRQERRKRGDREKYKQEGDRIKEKPNKDK